MKPKAGIYDPYLDTLGGGERYCLTIAETLLKNGYDVDLFWSGDRKILSKASDRFGINTNKINFVKDIFSEKVHHVDLIDDRQILKNIVNQPLFNKNSLLKKLISLYNKFQVTRQYDLFFFLSDGSLPFLFSHRNYLHIQVPYAHPDHHRPTILDKLKGKLISKIICNSKFTQSFSEKQFHRSCSVLYPPVNFHQFKADAPKNNVILSVGRFDNILNCKKQDCLINAFISLLEKHHLRGWKLILAGGSLETPVNNHYLRLLQEKSANYPIEIFVNPSFNDLVRLYSLSKLYWHAAGYGIDENAHPEQTEHFGITTVEAQASGLVPLVVAKGGLKETVTDGINGYLWNHLDDLVNKTYHLTQKPELIKQLSSQSILDSHRFSNDIFEREFINLTKS